ncbi:ataxin-2 homolog isoform X2 [Tripterygium wilfordii]|uniref:ataxin-2 homolog isoform X2 n=1 Tax=Tripterygium wilfordii TaxID=458696 RepID=UPI0018F82546|nr:ataxin-2 homolog isoform X2 [Tripterygium wilfordii]
MDPPPPPPPAAPPLTPTPAAVVTTTNTTTNLPTHLNAPTYTESIDSSPRSLNTDSWDDPPAPAGGGAVTTKLRLMCSYGGHIVPRPHDKSLCYVGGDTRIVVVDRHTSLASLSSRLSRTLLNDRPFTLKYQLPTEDLDSLISVTIDEDLENMIDEYDRTSGSSSKPSRLRLFLFPLKPDSSQSIGPLLENSAKSDDWFLNALNGAGLLNRGFSDSASVNCLLGLDDDAANGSNIVRDTEGSQKNVKQGQGQDVHSVPDSPMLETTSSFGSTSSSPSLANLPPIRVQVEDRGGVKIEQDQKVVGIEEQFMQMGFGTGQKQDEGFVVLSSAPPPPLPGTISVPGMPVSSGVVAGDYSNRVISDDERSDHGVPVGYRKPPTSQSQQQQQQTFLPQSQQKSSGGLDLPSPDSVSRFPASPVDPKINVSDPNNRVQLPPQQLQQQVHDSGLQSQFEQQQQRQVHESGYVLQSQFEQQSQQQQQQQQVHDSGYVLQSQFEQQSQQQQQQQQVHDSGYVLQSQFEQQQLQQQQQRQQPQQFIHAGTHYIQQHPTGAVPTYYPVYHSQPQHLQQQHHQLDHQFPMYYMPARQQPQGYNLPVQQSSISDAANTMPSSRSQTPPNPTIVAPSAGYNHVRNVPLSAKPEMIASNMYRTANAGGTSLLQVPSSQHQQQYVGYSQIHHPSQSGGPPTTAATNFVYEYTDPAHHQVYYTQPLAPSMPSQYQTMTTASGVAMPEVSLQIPTENIKQQIRTSQAQ